MTEFEAEGIRKQIVREGLLSILSPHEADRLIAKEPALADLAAIAIGAARSRAGMTPTALSEYAAPRWKIIAETSGIPFDPTPDPDFDLDASLLAIRVYVRGWLGEQAEA